jgi:hypothetical protein
VHDYAPGVYTVRFSGVDTNGNSAGWQLVVTVYRRLRPAIDARSLGARTWRFTGSARGGLRPRLAYRWDFSDGASAEGKTVEHRFAPSVNAGATLTVADGTTMTASATW